MIPSHDDEARAAQSSHAHLLQPIRDIAANWEIDIASELEEYLEVLESVTFSVEGAKNVNFAEAALLIQGSAHVYSKKVEYLHQLVYQALDVIADKQQRQSRASRQGRDEDFDEEEMFLRLDDVLEAGKDIDMVESESPRITRPLQTPAALLALEQSAPGYGHGTAGSFRIASCAVHQSGALLIEPHGGDGLDHMLRRIATRTSPSGAYHAPPVGPDGAAPNSEPPTDEPLASPAVGASVDDAYAGGDEGVYDDDDGGGMDWAGDEGPSPAHHAQDAEPAESAAEQQQRQAAAAADDEEGEDEFDPWVPLDMHDPGTMARKPFRRAQRLPKFRRSLPPALPASDGRVPDAVPGQLAFAEFQPALQRLQQAKRVAAAAVLRSAVRRSAWERPPLPEQEAADDVAGGYDGGDAYNDAGGWDEDGGACMDPLSDDDGDYMPLPDADEQGVMAIGGGGGDGSGAGPSYEELCRAHVNAFISAAAAADVQSALATRVSTWRSRVQPLIDEQDAREAFDMQVYGERILGRLSALELGSPGEGSGLPRATHLGAALGDTDQWQVSRLFAAMLQLVNAGNLSVDKSAPAARLQIHSLTLADLQKGYQAPSQRHKGGSCTVEAEDASENINANVMEVA